jgi:hypothetical protein
MSAEFTDTGLFVLVANLFTQELNLLSNEEIKFTS